jgi:outer membrane protein assembly factor BamB
MSLRSCRYLVVFLAFACLSAACQTPTPEGDTEVALFRNDLRHTGVYDTPAVHRFGAVAWSFETRGPVRAAPTVAGDALYVGSGDGALYALDRRDGTERWRFQTGGAAHSAPAVAGGTVFFTSRDRNLYALDARTGAERWRFETSALLPLPWGFDYYLSSPMVLDGVVYFGAGDGHLYAVEARSGRERWRFQAGGRIRTAPAIDAGTAYLGTLAGRFFALDLATGQERWHFDIDGAAMDAADFGFDRSAIVSSAVLSDDLVVFGGRDGYVYALDRQTGQERWRFNHEVSWAISSPALQDGTVFTGTSDGRFFQALDLATGQEQWRFDTQGVSWSSPALAGGVVYFGDSAGYVYALDAATGALKWKYETQGPVFASPVVDEGVVYVGSDDGRLYALAGDTLDAAGAPPRAAARAVYWDADLSPARYRPVRDYFESAGYEVLDTPGLANFMRAHAVDTSRSVVVIAAAEMPAGVVDARTGQHPIRQYLDAGGKVVWMGGGPFDLQDGALPAEGEGGASAAERVLGVPGPSRRLFLATPARSSTRRCRRSSAFRRFSPVRSTSCPATPRGRSPATPRWG